MGLPATEKTRSFKILALVSLGFLFSLGFSYFQHHGAGDGLQLSFNTFTWVIYSLFVGSALAYVAASRTLVASRLLAQLTLCVGVLLIPVIFSDSKALIDLGRFYGLFAGCLFYFSLVQLRLSSRHLLIIFMAILFGALLQAILGWLQYLKLLPAGWLGYLPNDTTPYGIFRQRNVMASFLATGLVLSGFVTAWAKDITAPFRPIYLQLTCVAVITPLLVVLNSRAGWVGAMLAVLSIAPYIYQRLGRRYLVLWFGSILLGIAIGISCLLVNDAINETTSRIQIDPARKAFYPVVIDLFRENIFTGVGLGNFEAAFNEFAAAQYAAGEAQPSGVTNLHHPHNEILFWAAEGGILSLLALLGASGFVFLRVIRLEWKRALAFIALFFPIVLHTQTEYPFYHSAIHWLVFIFLIFFLDWHSASQKVIKLKSPLIFGVGAIVIPATVGAFMTTTLQTAAILYRYEQVPGTSPEVLLSLPNPMIWRDRILWQVRTNLMLAGISVGDNSQVQPFIDLLSERLKEKPRWQNYQDLIFAHDFIGQTRQADRLFDEANFRFPTIEFHRLRQNTFTLRSYNPEPVGVENYQ